MDFSATAILLLLVAITWLIFTYARMLAERRQLPPGPRPLPLIGNLLHVKLNDIVRSLMELHKKYGPVYTIYLGNKPCLVLCGYGAMKEALIDHADDFADRGVYPVFLSCTKGQGIAFNNGEKWKELRRFSLTTLRNFGMGKRSIEERIQEEAQFLVKEFKNTKMAPIEPTIYFSRTVSNIICSVVFGKRFQYDDQRLLDIVNSIGGNFQIMSNTWGTMYNIYPDIMNYLPGLHQRIFTNFNKISKVILDGIKSHLRTHDPNCPRDYMDCFITKMTEEKNKPLPYFNDMSMLMSIQNLLFGGTETVSTTLRYGFLILMKYPQITLKMQEEIDNVVGPNRSPSFDDRSKMPYTDAVIHEIQRFTDVIPLSLPRSVTRDITFRGYNIPKGTYVIPLLTSVHYDATMFKNPEVFDPQHFLDDKGSFKKNDALMPFAAGKRVCPGESMAKMELFLYFTTILQNFTFKPLVAPEEIDLTPIGSGLGNVPVDYKCCIIPRQC
ncbi:cytochrome P450 2F2-like isoform X1 [Ambystoma mexicanum]|uniref:cytochrome P450 2F2-like isoform X1 n=1 Tax=Ambystoma mexicanum TaxID=8296 RepID=UPI0037E8C5A4